MEQVVGIVTDSSCDLPRRLVERLKIAVAPLIVRFGPEVYQDGELSAEEFWEKAAGPHHPYTSQPPVGVFEELYERLVAQGKRVLCLTITAHPQWDVQRRAPGGPALWRCGTGVRFPFAFAGSGRTGFGGGPGCAGRALDAGHPRAAGGYAGADSPDDRVGHAGEPAAWRTGRWVYRHRGPDDAGAQHQARHQRGRRPTAAPGRGPLVSSREIITSAFIPTRRTLSPKPSI